MANQEVEKVWNSFWKDLVTKPGYGVSLDLIKKELYDYHTLLENVPKVYDAVTDGRISKPNTDADVVTAEFEQYVDSLIDEALKTHDENIGSGMSM